MHGRLAGFTLLKSRARGRVPVALIRLAAAAAAVLPGAAVAALPVGAQAPDFAAEAALNGSQFRFSLAEALKRGPVVVYFYPAAFTKGCTIEAHDFAAAMPEFSSAGASVIGVSEDRIATLDRFSVSECQGRFPVAADSDGSIARQYDARIPLLHAYASRTSYVIAPDGRVLESYSAMNPDGHVEKTLAAVKAFRAR